MFSSLIKRKTFISMLFIALCLLGYISYSNLNYELYPSVELPVMIVRADARIDVSPSYVEQNALIPLEGAIGTLENIESIDSYADYRSGTIFITYKDNTNTKYAYLKLQQKIESIKSSLDNDFIVNVLKIDTKQISNQFMDLQVRGTGGSDRIRNIVDNSITDKLESIDGVASVEVFGGQEKSIEVILNEEATEAYGLTPSRISALISSNNHDRTFVGTAYEGKNKVFVNVTAENKKLTDLENIIVNPNGPVRLKDVATIFFGKKEETSYSRVNGKESVTLRLIRDSQANLINTSHSVKDIIAVLNSELKNQDVEIVVQRNIADDMENNINEIIQLALIGALLAIIVLWIFLKNLKLVFTIGLAIPISIFTAFNFFYAYDISINSLTLIGMALAVGMLLDNSIVVLENIFRLKSKGMSKDDAVVIGTKEVWRSIIAATLTTVTVFLPFVFSSNFLVKTFGLHIGVSIVSTLLVSLLLALLLIPIITHTFMKDKDSTTIKSDSTYGSSRLIQVYVVLLKACMRFPARTIIGAITVFFISVFVALAISVNTTKEVESDTFNLYVEMPEGSTLDLSNQTAMEVEKRLDDIAEKEDVISKVYEDQSTITIKLNENYKDSSNKSIEEIKEDIQARVENISSAEISFDEPQSSQRFRGGAGAAMGGKFEKMLGIGSQSEKIVLKGTDYDKMVKTAESLQYYLEQLSSVRMARVSVSGERPEIHLKFDDHLMSQLGISLNDVISELATFRSQFSSNTIFKQGTEEYDIVIRTSDNEEEENKDKTSDDLRNLKVSGSESTSHTLNEIANVIYANGMASISRVNQEKQVEVTYRLLNEVNESKELLESAREEIDELVAEISIPNGVAIEVIHDDTEYDEYYFLIAVAFILIFMILASVFESVVTPFVLMLSIPLAAIGSLLALILTNNSLLNSNTLMGFLILLGIVVNNGIILIDYTNILRKKSYSLPRALVTAGTARVRPILITAITTIVGMIPLALGDKEYVAAIGAPFAITVIGGLSVSTLFTLIFIPTFYSGVFSALKWLNRLDWKIKLIQAAVFITLATFIYFDIDSFIWQMVDLFLLAITVPGLTYFILNSLRQASEKIVAKEDSIRIEIKNVVKIYDHGSRFIREWNRTKSINKNLSISEVLNNLVWQLPSFGFLLYFTYWYLESPFWIFISSHLVFFTLLILNKSTIQTIANSLRLKNIFLNNYKLRHKLILFIFPVFSLIFFYLRWENIGLLIFIGAVWYSAIFIHLTSEKLFKQNFDYSELSGKFAIFRRLYYDLVKSIPIIGRKRKPFKALNGVTLTIESGMFGLLGPNGAGKTTLMRIICGILEQSYGKVSINGLDRNEYREELQGIIGYLPQDFGMYENMSAYEFLDYQAILKNIYDTKVREERITQVLNEVHLYERRNEKIGSFSGGMKQRVGIAQIMLNLPKILVVDEPTAGLDPRERIRFRNLLVELSRERVVIFSTHIIEDISSSCNKIAVMNEGNVKYLGEPSQMTKIAEGKVWYFHIKPSEFNDIQNKYLIVNHMRDGELIKIRTISEDKPSDNAVNIKPTLEDAYLYLQKINKTSIFN